MLDDNEPSGGRLDTCNHALCLINDAANTVYIDASIYHTGAPEIYALSEVDCEVGIIYRSPRILIGSIKK